MRLIDADALISFIDPEHLRHSGELTFSEVDVINMLNHAPTVLGKESHGVLRKIANYLIKEYEGDDDNAPTLDITISDMREICTMHQDLIGERELLKQWQMYGRVWIPCSERLPEKPVVGEDCYLIQAQYVEQSFVAYWDGRNWTDECYEIAKHVIAWMPLPKPYRGE